MTTPRTVTIATKNEQSVLNLTSTEIFELVVSMTQGPIIMLGLEEENSNKLLADIPIIGSISKDDGVKVTINKTSVGDPYNSIFSDCVISLCQHLPGWTLLVQDLKKKPRSSIVTLYQIPSIGYSIKKV